MANQPYEILLRWKDGVYAGGHIAHIDSVTGAIAGPVAIGSAAHPWPEALALAQQAVDGELAAARAEAADLQERLRAAQEEAKAAASSFEEQIRIARLPTEEQQRLALDEEHAALSARLEQIEAAKAGL